MNLRRLSAEFIGTFFLILVITMTTYAKVSADLQPIAIGLMLIGLIYANEIGRASCRERVSVLV